MDELNINSVERREGRGRCFIAQKNYDAGETILIEEAYAAVISSSYRESSCAYCGQFPINTAYTLNSNDESRYEVIRVHGILSYIRMISLFVRY